MEKFVIIVGGGLGTRMKSILPKQFMTLTGEPVLMHSLRAFADSLAQPTIMLVLHKQLIAQWKELCAQYTFTIPHYLVEGGSTRFHSVQNGLDYIQQHFRLSGEPLIAVHDGVRPIISKALIERGFSEVVTKDALVPVVASRESVRIRKEAHSEAINRETVLLVQTPQFFKGNILFKAYRQDYLEMFTDDATVVEKAGYAIHTIPGDTRNIKITFPEDLPFAELLLKLK